MKTYRRTATLLAIELWLPTVLIVVWWLTTRNSTSFYFPPLTEVLASFRDNWLFARVGSDVVPSLLNLFAGLLISSALGLSGGLLLGLSPTAEEISRPVTAFFRALPGVALLPLLITVIGIGAKMSIPLITFVTVWPILLNTIDGVRAIEPTVHDMRRTFGIGRLTTLRKIIIPASSPQIVVGLRQALSMGLAVLIFSELVGATKGIGFFTLQAQRNLEVPDMWSGILLLGALGYVFNLSFRAIERHVLAWHHLRAQASTGGKS